MGQKLAWLLSSGGTIQSDELDPLENAHYNYNGVIQGKTIYSQTEMVFQWTPTY